VNPVIVFNRKKFITYQAIHREQIKGRNSKPETNCIHRSFISQLKLIKRACQVVKSSARTDLYFTLTVSLNILDGPRHRSQILSRMLRPQYLSRCFTFASRMSRLALYKRDLFSEITILTYLTN